jgi:hypothetical protein
MRTVIFVLLSQSRLLKSIMDDRGNCCGIFTMMWIICSSKNTIQSNLRTTTTLGNIVAIVDKWSLFRGHLYYKTSKWDLRMVDVIDRWSLFGGGRKLSFDCTLNKGLT